jgi:hypothetical protein
MKQKIIKTIVMLTLITGFISYAASAQTGEILTNTDVVKLTKMGLAPATIINKIEATNSDFNVSVDSLVALKKQGVDKDVINEMVNVTTQPPPDGQQNGQGDAQYQNGQGAAPYQNPQSAPPPASYSDAPKDPNDPKTWRPEGIYYFNNSNPGNMVQAIAAKAFSGMKTGGYGTRVAQYYTYGFAKNKQEAVLDGPVSHKQIHQPNPVFYFYFSSDNISPNQFVLVNLIRKRDTRIMVVGSSNYYERSRGIDEKERVDFTYDYVASGIYKVYTRTPLKPGEYCFVYDGPRPSPFSNEVYDFGINP